MKSSCKHIRRHHEAALGTFDSCKDVERQKEQGPDKLDDGMETAHYGKDL